MVEHPSPDRFLKPRYQKINVILKRTVQIILMGAILLGVYFRLYHITANQLFYYDEGHYLTIHRTFDEILSKNPPNSFSEFLTIMKYNLFLSLKTGKGLWFFLSHLRGFWGGFDMFYFPRVLACAFGIMTIAVAYAFAWRYYGNHDAALLSATFLAILPSHIFYSRLGLQETLSALCLLGGFYFYLFPPRLGKRTFLASLLFALAYFSNYRLFIIPGLLGFVELFQAVSLKQKIDFHRFVWCVITFAVIVISLGMLDNAGHLNIIFFWMLRQSQEAKGHFHWMNLLSFPYAIFKLEGLVFGSLFFANVYLAFKKKWQLMMPFALALFHMLIFSFAHEKGVRYLVVIMPFLAMAVAYGALLWFQEASHKKLKYTAYGLVAFMMVAQIISAHQIRHFKSDYFTAMQDLMTKEDGVKVLTTQPFVQNLAAPKREDVMEMPHTFRPLVAYFLNGYHYMILDPQAYISYTKDGERFEAQLEEHLAFILSNIKPIKEYDHFSSAMMERFVLEHNVNLKRSLEFLKASRSDSYNRLRVYKAQDYVYEVFRRLQSSRAAKEAGNAP